VQIISPHTKTAIILRDFWKTPLFLLAGISSPIQILLREEKAQFAVFPQDEEITALLQTGKSDPPFFIRCYFDLNSNLVNVVLLHNRKAIWYLRSHCPYKRLVVDCSCSDGMK
jgi:hypothetical protein